MREAYGASARDIEVAVACEALSLPAELTTPIVLIVGEVVTNSLKHAFEGGASERIGVTVRRLNPREIEIEVRDDGAGFPEGQAAGRGGLGSRLIQALTEQLRGTATEANDHGGIPPGLRCDP
jgi:two-component sensor histidine kinase